MPLLIDYTCHIPEVIVERQHPLAEWRAGIVDHSVEIANDSYQRFNWLTPNLDATRTTIQKMFARSW